MSIPTSVIVAATSAKADLDALLALGAAADPATAKKLITRPCDLLRVAGDRLAVDEAAREKESVIGTAVAAADADRPKPTPEPLPVPGGA